MNDFRYWVIETNLSILRCVPKEIKYQLIPYRQYLYRQIDVIRTPLGQELEELVSSEESGGSDASL